MSEDEYLALDRESDERWEYVAGEAFECMAARPEHNIVVADVGCALGNALAGKPCGGSPPHLNGVHRVGIDECIQVSRRLRRATGPIASLGDVGPAVTATVQPQSPHVCASLTVVGPTPMK